MNALSRRAFLTTTAAGSLAAAVVPASTLAPAFARAAGISAEEARQIAMDAYIYGYSLVTTDVTRLQMSNVAKAGLMSGPLGSFFNVRGYPPATYRGVSATNADTLYSMAWLDLKEPMVFSHPEIKDRFFNFELIDLWMVVEHAVGTNTTGTAAATYLFTGPGWKGEVPKGMIHIAYPTRYLGVLGRTYALDTPEDLAIVHKLQDQYKVVPLSSYGKDYTFVAPPIVDAGIKMDEAPQKVILALGVEGYFDWMTRLMGTVAVPPAEDAPMLEKMAKIGIVPGQPFKLSSLDPAIRAALKDLPQRVTDKLNETWATLGKDVSGWRVTTTGAIYGTDYLTRAAWASNGWPSQQIQVSVYPTTYLDGAGGKLDGKNNYTLTFKKGEMPPINDQGFWSITMYQIDNGLWFYPNKLNKLTVSTRNMFVYNEDGSLTLYFQHESPGKDKEQNWLPAPAAPFALTLRMYWPNKTPPSILNGSWGPPPVMKA
ncbi:DUF1254 domain-containing protein [Xanthobacter sp. KR7-225]|uniref:DUF1254 domain-containing protein n=1 Tax=Xanthobacter sp. KR7-225 TaxID=3156613 RepID=UPI0032B350CE